jgi:hypothetical protein
VTWRALQVRVLGTLLFEQQVQIGGAPSPAPGAELQLVTGSLLACTAPIGQLRARLASVACLGGELGQLAGRGTDISSPRRRSALWAAPRVELGGFWAVPESSLRVGVIATVAVPLNRDEFVLSGIGTVHRPPNVVGRLSLGVGLGFD